jgi:hypothetical protein
VADFRIPRTNLTKPDDAEHVMWGVIERMYEELDTPYDPDPRLREATPGQRALYALHWLRSEVENGGFHQFFFNPTGMLGNEAAAGAERVGATQIAAVIREALTIFPDGLIEDNVQRQDFMERLSAEQVATLGRLDDRFYELMGSGDQAKLAEHCAAYVERHPDEFFSDSSRGRD